MINRLKNLELKFNLSKAAIIIGVLTLLSRLVGLVRDRLFASRFGAGDTLDVYYAAFRIPDFIFNLLILGTLSVAFIPIFTEWLLKDKNKAYRIANTVLNFSFLAMSAICLVLFFFSPALTKFLVPGFSPAKLAETVVLTKIFLLSPVIFTVSNVFGSILNSQKKFLIANLAPVLYNLGIICGLLFLFPVWGLKGLGWGVIIGAVLHLLFQVFESVRFGYSWQPAMDLKDQAVKKIGKLFLPRIFGLDTSQLSLLIGSVIGSFLTVGSIAVLNLANNLQAVPVGIFAISVAIAAFPALSESYALQDLAGFVKTLKNSITQILFFIIPISILMLLFRAYIVRLVYGAGKFSWESTILTFNTLGVFVFALFSQALAPLLARAFYARQNTKIPVVIGLASMALNVTLSYFFALRIYSIHINLPPIIFSLQTGGVVGIALGFAIASIINVLALFIILRQQLGKDLNNTPGVIKDFDLGLTQDVIKILAASVIMGIVGYTSIYLLAPLVNTRTGLGILIQSGLSVLLSVIVYIYLGLKLKLPEASSLINFLKRKVGLKV